jgi:hypothetical protein
MPNFLPSFRDDTGLHLSVPSIRHVTRSFSAKWRVIYLHDEYAGQNRLDGKSRCAHDGRLRLRFAVQN